MNPIDAARIAVQADQDQLAATFTHPKPPAWLGPVQGWDYVTDGRLITITTVGGYTLSVTETPDGTTGPIELVASDELPAWMDAPTARQHGHDLIAAANLIEQIDARRP